MHSSKPEHSASQRVIYARIVFKKHTFVRTYIYSEWIELDMRIRAVQFSVCVLDAQSLFTRVQLLSQTRDYRLRPAPIACVSVFGISLYSVLKRTHVL